MSRDILIYGAGGAGRDLAFALSLDKNPDTAWKVKGFIDDTEDLQGKIINDLPVLGGFELLKDYSGNITVTVLDHPLVRKVLISKIKTYPNVRFPKLIPSNPLISPRVEWGEGCVLMWPDNVVSVNIQFGDFAWMNGGNRIGHDVRIGDYTIIYSGVIVSGKASIGSGCLIGSGSIIMPKRKIGDGSYIGAGSLVSKDIPSGVVAVGVPAKIVKKIDRQFYNPKGPKGLGKETTRGKLKRAPGPLRGQEGFE